MTNLGYAVQARIRRAGSINKLAKETGLNKAYISRLSRGIKTNPSEETLQKLRITQHIIYTLKG